MPGKLRQTCGKNLHLVTSNHGVMPSPRPMDSPMKKMLCLWAKPVFWENNTSHELIDIFLCLNKH